VSAAAGAVGKLTNPKILDWFSCTELPTDIYFVI
jgi:hypothetical protein